MITRIYLLFQIFGFVSLAVVLVSTLTFVLQTLPAFEEGSSEYPIFVKILEIIDDAGVVFFSIEYLIRFICSPKKWRFFKRLDSRNINPVILLQIQPNNFSVLIFSNHSVYQAGSFVNIQRSFD